MMTHPQRMTRDTATYRPYRKPRSKAGGKLLPMSLKKLALEHLGRTIQEGQHHPVRASTVGKGVWVDAPVFDHRYPVPLR